MISGLFFLFEGLEDVGMVLRTVRYENGTKTVRYANEYQVIFAYGDFVGGVGTDLESKRWKKPDKLNTGWNGFGNCLGIVWELFGTI